ncbi:MAG: type II/IV secretion system ATPase subunit [Methanomicrobiaceae archaeon]|nr:type II/IV secretion system ATPase subunit [Methanomicrobiaceae archaeon]MDD5419406.1 type II/IV secretion system ATPase subunit [Methanomicrobiaceae archaeon]
MKDNDSTARELKNRIRSLFSQDKGKAAEIEGEGLPDDGDGPVVAAPGPAEDQNNEDAPAMSEANAPVESSPEKVPRGRQDLQSLIQQIVGSRDKTAAGYPAPPEPAAEPEESEPDLEESEPTLEEAELPDPMLAEEEAEEEAEPPMPDARPRIVADVMMGWSEEDEGGSGVISVEEAGAISDLILAKGATFSIEELHINRTTGIFDIIDSDKLSSEIDDLLAKTVPSEALRQAAIDVAGPEDGKDLAKPGLLKRIRVPAIGKQEIEAYNRAIHGPLVDLSFDPPTGVEEVELYPVHEPYAYVRVTYDSTTHEYTYNVIEPILTAAEDELFGEIKERLFETLEITTRDVTREFAREALRDAANAIIADYGIDLPTLSREKILYHVEKEFLGDGLVDPIMHDKYIEDISCDGVNSTIFVYHTTYESMKTNLAYRDAATLDSFVAKLAQRAGKYISIAEPMLDATMSDGSRIQMTLGTEVTAHGSTFTIRKFREEPITPTDLIEWGTFSPLGIAFIWLAVEGGKSCIFAGGTASGKTTSLNAISLFIPPLAKIVTLEDTRELKLPHPNWIPSITRDSFNTEGRGGIDMYELLRAALRQRPEYILVGEVRGREALTLFQAMSTGHVTYATMHADSVASAVHRLENPPISVPRNMLSALNLISIQVQARVGGQRIRRNKQLIEILDIDPRTNELITNEVFRWHPATDEIRYSGKSFILEQIMEERGWSEERMREELKRRQEVLEWMRLKKIRYFQDVSKILVSYFRDPEVVIARVRADLYE